MLQPHQHHIVQKEVRQRVSWRGKSLNQLRLKYLASADFTKMCQHVAGIRFQALEEAHSWVKRPEGKDSLDSLLIWLCKCLSGHCWPRWPWTPNAAVWTTSLIVSENEMRRFSPVLALGCHLLPSHTLGRCFWLAEPRSYDFAPAVGKAGDVSVNLSLWRRGQALLVWDPPN